MKHAQFNIFRRITILVFFLITILGILFTTITYLAITHYHQASTQLLNKDVAAHIAKFTSPFEGGTVNKQKADSVFYDAMVLSPSAEVYFLDTSGTVIAFHAPKAEIKRWTVPLANIHKYIAAKGLEYLRAPDPKDPLHPKIFSAAEVYGQNKKLGYIYVILGSKSAESAMSLLFGSHISSLAVKAFAAIFILSIVISFVYLARIRRSFNRMIAVLQRFEGGDYEARFPANERDELAPVTSAFNKMADLLTYNINRLTRSEQDRKDFIATISHDLRTPLSVARGYAETLLVKQGQGSVASEKDQYVQLIVSKIEQVESMVQQLFELSKMEAVQFKPQAEPFVLSEIVQEIINTFQLSAAHKNILLKCTQCLYHVWINADTAMMERVIQNLVDNAVKSTPEGGTIGSGLTVEENYLIFKIENSGPPLPNELLHWINNGNEAGLQAKRPAKAGLGLAIVQKILWLHNSCLQAAVQPDRNIFTFRLPVYHPGT